jgi:hypothetical protein
MKCYVTKFRGKNQQIVNKREILDILCDVMACADKTEPTRVIVVRRHFVGAHIYAKYNTGITLDFDLGEHRI